MPRSNALLITSTIAPKKNTYLLKVNNHRERYAQYESALRFYIKLLKSKTIDFIVYVDNSGYPLDKLKDVALEYGVKDRIEFISYQSELNSQNSRYYLEIHLIDEALRKSLKISSAAKDTILWKVTGRYKVVNADKIIKSYPADTDLYINLRNKPYKTLDFYFTGFKIGSYPLHIGNKLTDFEGINNGEDILRSKIDAGDFSDVKVTPRFSITPRLSGIRGFDGSRYGSLPDTFKYYIRKIANRLAPKLWI